MDGSRGRDVTIVTAVGRREPERWQREQIASVEEFAASRRNAHIRWIRCIDGEDAAALEASSAGNLEVITLGAASSNRIGMARTRNRCLPMLLEGWVVTLDSDDLLFTDALQCQITTTEDSGALWSAALCNDISPEGDVVYEGVNPFPPGRLAAGTFLQYTALRGVSPWVCSATLIDSALLTLCGGWAEFPREDRLDDTALIARVTAIDDGVWVPIVVQAYRKHERQTTAGREHLMDRRRVELVEKYVAETGWRNVAGHV